MKRSFFLLFLFCCLQSLSHFAGTALAHLSVELIESAKIGDIQKVSTLLAQGAEINATDNQGVTALSWSSYNGHAEVVKTLIDGGADINHQDNDGMTALMVASFKGYSNIVNTLIKDGANIYIRDNSGKTALQMAKFNNHYETSRILEKNIENNHGG